MVLRRRCVQLSRCRRLICRTLRKTSTEQAWATQGIYADASTRQEQRTGKGWPYSGFAGWTLLNKHIVKNTLASATPIGCSKKNRARTRVRQKTPLPRYPLQVATMLLHDEGGLAAGAVEGRGLAPDDQHHSATRPVPRNPASATAAAVVRRRC